MNQSFQVSGMTCGHCVAAVTEEVTAIPGVSEVKVELAGPMQVESTAEVDFAAVVAAVKEAGDYEVRERSEGDRILYRFQKPKAEDFPAML